MILTLKSLHFGVPPTALAPPRCSCCSRSRRENAARSRLASAVRPAR